MTTVSYKLKPAVSRGMQLLVAASIWTIVGGCLLGFGMKWMLQSDTTNLLWLILAAIIVGAAKGYFILRKTANRNVRRIVDRGDGKCIFGVFSIAS